MENGDHRGSHGQAYKDKSKPTDIRSSNINAAKGKITIENFGAPISGCILAVRRVTENACEVEENITLYSNGRIQAGETARCKIEQ